VPGEHQPARAPRGQGRPAGSHAPRAHETTSISCRRTKRANFKALATFRELRIGSSTMFCGGSDESSANSGDEGINATKDVP